ncbi:MAG: transglutaminase domain-containing protein [Chitinophagaceae bacterium]|nr:transglutaminase domain-containing protein [Chitinophagaceae bacterium]
MMLLTKIPVYATFLAVSFFISNCSNTRYPFNVRVDYAIKYAGKNSSELKKAIGYYSNKSGDSLKLKAACFLIANMPGKGFEEYELRDSTGIKVNIDLFIFRNSDSLEQFKRKYEIKHHTKISYVKIGFKEDVKYITADLLIENIEYAFKAWQFPWAAHLTFAQFCELILPYRIGNEPLQHWRKTFFERYIWIADSIQCKEDIIKACSIINDRLKGKYEYKHGALDFYRGMLDVEKVEKFGGGRCEDLNMYAGYCMRSVGIPVALEFTPYWANSNYGGHSWLGVLNYTRKFVPFNAVYDNPILDSLPFKGAKLAKAYRTTFEEQKDCFGCKFSNTDQIPPFFRGKNFIDITNEYLKTSMVSISLNKKFDSTSFIYLGILNGKNWKPIHWGIIKEDSAVFEAMAREVIYLPIYYFDKGYYAGGDYIVAGDAFFLRANGEKLMLIPDITKRHKMSFDLSQLPWLIPGRKYNVIYWDGIDWRGDTTRGLLKINPRVLKIMERMLDISGVPNNTMYRVFSDSITNETALGRPFIYNVDQKRYRDY